MFGFHHLNMVFLTTQSENGLFLFNARFCHKLVPVAKCLIHGKNNPYDQRKIVEGLAHFLKLPAQKYQVIYPGTYIPEAAGIHNAINQKEDSVLLVAKIDSRQTYEIKAIGFYLDIAKKIGKYHFYLIGAKEQIIRKIYKERLPENLTLIPFLPLNQIYSYYLNAKVIFIPSITEGCPNVLLEGMAHGCVPIGSPRGAIPEVIGKTGKIINHMNVEEACQAIEWAIQKGNGRLAYKRCRQNFSFEVREQKLFALLDDMLN